LETETGEDMPKILLVDDEVQLQTMVQMRLEANCYEVITASDGQEGLQKAKSENPDLIMMDVMMPKMDGYKVCGLLKNDTRYSKIPVVLFTARAQQDDQEVGKEAGADAYITKPFDPPVLLAKIEELLKKSA
jgi:DNA-binding response OmpR family regulator